MRRQRNERSQNNLKHENKEGVIGLSNFKTYYIAKLIKTLCYWQAESGTEWRTKKQNHKSMSNFFLIKVQKQLKIVPLTKVAEAIGYHRHKNKCRLKSHTLYKKITQNGAYTQMKVFYKICR